MSSYEKLPQWWKALPSLYKGHVIRQLQEGTAVFMMPIWWREKHYSERWAVIRYLQSVGSLTHGQVQALVTPQREANGEFVRGLPVYDPQKDLFRIMGDEDRLHDRPNGGRRIISSDYSKITGHWLRGNGVMVRFEDMDRNHLQNCVNLLKESHSNLAGQMTMLLGVVHAKYRAVPTVQRLVEAACLAIMAADVDEVYPVFDELCAEIERRDSAPKRHEAIDESITFDDLLAAALRKW